MKRLRKFFRLPGGDRYLLMQAALLLSLARLALMALPFSYIASRLGRYQAIHQAEVCFQDSDAVQRVSWAVAVMSRSLPWSCSCLCQAVTAKYLLSRYGCPSTLYLGVCKDEQGTLLAHAWLRSAGRIVTGEQNLERFVVISTFA